MGFLKSFRMPWQKEFITIVSGLPRSGTSMMMKMLEAGGIPPITDGLRQADIDNPRGYYEFERVKKLPEGDREWLEEARGKAVKVIYALLEYLPAKYEYRIIFMDREMDEIIGSQREMLINSGKYSETIENEKIADQFRKQIAKTDSWLKTQDNIKVIHISYNEIMKTPMPVLEKLNSFLDNRLDTSKMAGVVDASLYRVRQ